MTPLNVNSMITAGQKKPRARIWKFTTPTFFVCLKRGKRRKNIAAATAKRWKLLSLRGFLAGSITRQI